MGKITLSADSVAMRDVLNQLDAVGDLPSRGDAALRAGAEVLLPEVLQRAPVRTGGLKKALRIDKRGGRRNRGKSIEVGTFDGEAPHAHLVEGGHGGPAPAPPHPFMEPAVAAKEDEIMDAIMAELTRGLGL